MAVKNYFTEDGVITGEETGGVYTDYLTDALGSVTATVDQSQNILNTYRHKPYGGLLAKTGVGPDPDFLWVGTYGYKNTGLPHCSHYVRARHFESASCQWTTRDPVWPAQPPFSYTRVRPATYIDPSGLAAANACCCEADSIATSDPQVIINAPRWLPPTICGEQRFPSGTRHTTVALFWVTFGWKANHPIGPYIDMLPCRIKWEEFWSRDLPSGTYHETKVDKGWVVAQYQMWNCCKAKDLCASDSCSIWDAPGQWLGSNALQDCAKKYGLSYIEDVCMKWTFESSCKGGKTIVKYYEFRLEVTKDGQFIVPKPKIVPSCQPRPNPLVGVRC